LIHRFLYSALQKGLALFEAKPSMYQSLFGELYGLVPSEVEAVRKRFAQNFPRIEHAYSPEAATMPCYSIVMGSEQQNNFMLANSAGVLPGFSGPAAPLFTTIWRHQYSILCYAQQPDLVEYMYELAKCCISLQLRYLISLNCNEVQLSGSEMTLDEKPPERLFYRSLGFSCSREFRFFASDDVTRLFKVDGLFVNDNKTAANGGVTALIKATTPPPTKP
jgi:hypothetical protein